MTRNAPGQLDLLDPQPALRAGMTYRETARSLCLSATTVWRRVQASGATPSAVTASPPREPTLAERAAALRAIMPFVCEPEPVGPSPRCCWGGCGERSAPGVSYCPGHRAIVYRSAG